MVSFVVHVMEVVKADRLDRHRSLGHLFIFFKHSVSTTLELQLIPKGLKRHGVCGEPARYSPEPQRPEPHPVQKEEPCTFKQPLLKQSTKRTTKLDLRALNIRSRQYWWHGTGRPEVMD
ncbi:hypothetical protein SRHO_G00303040 [Serrasalmus rhombeus]